MAARIRRTRRVSRVPSVFGTTVDTGNSITADTAFAADLSAAAETVSGREFNRSVFRGARGVIQLLVNPTAADTFTRTAVGFGIRWESEDLVNDQSTLAHYPGPLEDEYNWIWRHHALVNYVPRVAAAGSDIDLYGGLIRLRTSAMRKQPSPKHSLFLFAEYDDTHDANITSVTFAFSITAQFKDS